MYIHRFGPLVRFWTMRYEAKHSYFKKLAQNVGNFINVPWMLATRHQLWQCYTIGSTPTLFPMPNQKLVQVQLTLLVLIV